MRRFVRRIWLFGSLDYSAAERYLERMAAKGYILKEIEQNFGLFAFFEKLQPQRLRYSIDGFKGNREEKDAYIQFAKDLEWDTAAETPGQIVFVSDARRDLPPIQTDWRVEYQQIRKGLWKKDLSLGLTALIFIWLMIKIGWFSDFDLSMEAVGEDWISSGRLISASVLLGSMVLLFLRAIRFWICSEIALRLDRPMKTVHGRWGNVWRFISTAEGLSILLMVILNIVWVIREEFRIDGILSVIIACYMVLLLAAVLGALTWEGRKVLKEKKGKKALTAFWIIGMVLMIVQCVAS